MYVNDVFDVKLPTESIAQARTTTRTENPGLWYPCSWLWGHGFMVPVMGVFLVLQEGIPML